MSISARDLAWNVLLAALYCLTAHLSLELASLQGNVSPFWPASGVATAAILLGGRRLWPGIFLGAFIANAISPAPFAAAAGIAVGNTIEALTAAFLQQKISGRDSLGRFARLTAWVVASLIAPLASMLPGVTTLWLSGLADASSLAPLALTWWVGDSIGLIVVAPALLALRDAPQWRPSRSDLARAAALIVVSLGVCAWIFFGPRGSRYLFAVFPLLILATAWFGANGAKLTCLGIVLFCVIAVGLAQPIFDGGTFNSIHLQHETLFYSLALAAQVLAVFREQRCLQLPGLVLLGSWILSGWIFAALETSRSNVESLRFANLTSEASEAVKQRMTTYVDALYAGASLFTASENVSRTEWRTYVQSLRLVDRYPGINGIGYIAFVRPRALETFLETVRADGAPDFAIRSVPNVPAPPADPAGESRYVITYIEPEATNRQAVGLDVASEANRQSAARIARDYGVPRITRRINLVQDGLGRAGFLVYVPMYLNGTQHDTVHTRRLNFRGWIYAPFIAENFFKGVLGNRGPLLELSVFDGMDPSPENRIFGPAESAVDSFKLTSVIQLNGRMFTCGWTPGPDFPVAGNESLFNALTLALVPILIASVLMTLQTSERHANAVADARTRELLNVNERLEIQVAEREAAEREAREASRAAEAANAAKSEFLATMSHEIRTPLNGIIGYTELLADSRLTTDQADWARTIRNSGTALLTIINDILDFSKIEAGLLKLEAIPFDPLETTRDVLEILKWEADKKSLRLSVTSRNPIPQRLVGDPTRFRQILLNLVSNALKFTERGSVEVDLKWRASGSLLVRVTDTGLGIPEAKIPRLFQRFSQLDSSTTRRFGGTGLGLAICRTLVLLMRGKIGVRSDGATGTTFWFTSPFATSAAKQRSSLQSAPPDRDFARGTHILVAEDIPTNQKLAAALLSRMGCEVEIATTGREAVRKALAADFDIIYMDCQMPELDGYSATRELRSTGFSTPIVALTASALDGERQRCLDAGMDDFMTKPFIRDDFVRTLHRWKNQAALPPAETPS